MGPVTPSTPYFVILSYVPKICSLSTSVIADMNSQQIRQLKLRHRIVLTQVGIYYQLLVAKV